MQKIQILLSNPNKSLSFLPKKYLLIDTNFLIEISRHPSQFMELVKDLNNNGFILVSIEATLIEFVKGSKSIEDHSKKVKFYKNIIERILPLEREIHDNVSKITRVLLNKGGQLSYADCLLLGITMKYKDNLYFLTKDRSDVPISLFNTVASIMIETQDNNSTFNIYEYDEKAYEELLIQLVNDIKVKK